MVITKRKVKRWVRRLNPFVLLIESSDAILQWQERRRLKREHEQFVKERGDNYGTFLRKNGRLYRRDEDGKLWQVSLRGERLRRVDDVDFAKPHDDSGRPRGAT